MAVRNHHDGVNAFQTFSTLLALLIPILQFFFSFLPDSSQNIFVFNKILIPVSIIAGVFSYLLIIAFKNTTWFKIAFNRTKHREYDEFEDQIKVVQAEPDVTKRESQAKQLLKNQKKPPFYLTPLNIYYLLIPLLLIFIMVFLALGVFYANTTNRLVILIQSISYVLTVAFTSLTLAVFYINETNRKNAQELNRSKYQKIIQLLFDSNSLPHLPRIEFVAQVSPQDSTDLKTYIRVNNALVYEIITDQDGDILRQVIPSSNQPQQSEGS
jgi:sensor histidine kinase YesM